MKYFVHWRSVIVGFVMGAAELVPGVSGGTIAFISGIYDRLLAAINHVDARLFQLLIGRQWLAVWRHLDMGFLITLVLGMGAAILVLAPLVSTLLHDAPVFMAALFFGLIVGSIVHIWARHWSPAALPWFFLGVVLALVLQQLPDMSEQVNMLWIFAAGAIAISAWILPGLSGSYMLLILGLYPLILSAIAELNLPILVVFASGCAVGLLLFSRMLAYLLRQYEAATLMLLLGLMLGAIEKVWPWHDVSLPKQGFLYGWHQVVMPQRYDTEFFWILVLMVTGFVLVAGLGKLGDHAAHN